MCYEDAQLLHTMSPKNAGNRFCESFNVWYNDQTFTFLGVVLLVPLSLNSVVVHFAFDMVKGPLRITTLS